MYDFPKGKGGKAFQRGRKLHTKAYFTYKEDLHIRHHVNEDSLRYSRQAIKKILKVVMAMALFFTQQRQQMTAYPSIRYLCMSVN